MLQKVKSFIREKRNEVLQFIADSILIGMEYSKSDKEFKALYEMGFKMNIWCEFYDIELK